MPEQKNNPILTPQRILWLIIAIIVVNFVVNHLAATGKFLIVILGFGIMVLIHELGHFTFAKLSKIKVEAFSIGMPPTVLGIMRTEKGYRVRLLPFLFNKEKEETGQGGLTFHFGKKKKPGETEYQIGLIPFGGFVKMLGQEDFGQAKQSNDPKSYTNKPPHTRLAVIAGGVTFNVISAVIFFIIAFMVGIKSPAPVVGGLDPDYPAAKTNLKPGDEFIEIEGQTKDLDFTDIMLSAVLSEPAQEIPVKVKHTDNTVEKIYLTAEKKPGDQQPAFGIESALSLTIAALNPKDTNDLIGQTGLMPGDKIVSVNNKDIEHFWQLQDILKTYPESVSLLAERKTADNKTKFVETTIGVSIAFNNICSMVPRLKVEMIAKPKPSLTQLLLRNLKKWFSKNQKKYTLDLKAGDIIIKAGDVNYPTYSQLREITEAHCDKPLPLKVARTQKDGTEKIVDVTVIPTRQKNRVVIGFLNSMDVDHPVIAQTIDTGDEFGKLDIPPGATINKVNGSVVANFIEITRQLLKNKSRKHTIEFTTVSGQKGSVSFETDNIDRLVTAEPFLNAPIPFDTLQRTYKAANPADAAAMGFRKTYRMLKMSYASIRAMIQGRVSTDSAAGPIGILHMGYQIVSQKPLVYYVYFIGLISIAIAVFNFLPFTPLDGGLAVFLLIEKIKGSPVNPKFQFAMASFGWILIGALAIYITMNDIARILTGLF